MQTPDNNLKKRETCNLQEKNDTGKSDFRSHETQYFSDKGHSVVTFALRGKGDLQNATAREQVEGGMSHICKRSHVNLFN